MDQPPSSPQPLIPIAAVGNPAQAPAIPPNSLLVLGEWFLRKRDSHSIARLARLNQAWRDAMLSVLYRSFPKRIRQPSVASFQVNSFRVQVLSFKNGPGTLNNIPIMRDLYRNAIQFPNVVELSLWFFGADDPIIVEAISIMQTFNSLLDLRLEDFHPLFDRDGRWSEILSTCHLTLTALTLKKVLLNDEATRIVYSMPLLSTLKFIDSQFGTIMRQMPTVQHLTIDRAAIPFSQQLKWFLRCCNLTSLRWDSTGTTDTELTVCSAALANQSWPSLKVIDLQNSTSQLKDTFVSRMLNAARRHLDAPVPQLTSVTVLGARFWFRSFAALESHFGTLTELNLYKCLNLRGWMSQRVMENCPLLTTFRGAMIEAHDLIDYRWADLKRDDQIELERKADDALMTLEENQSDGGYPASPSAQRSLRRNKCPQPRQLGL